MTRTSRAKIRNDTNTPFNTLYGLFTMKPLSKKTAILLAAGTASLIAASPAFAEGAGDKAIAELNEYAELMGELETLQASIANVRIKDEYCDEVHATDKRADRKTLRDLEKAANEKAQRLSQIRRTLIHTVRRNQIARTALDQEIDGGSGHIVDDSYFRSFRSLRAAINRTLTNKKDALKNAPEKNCGMHGQQDEKPAIAVVTPLAGVVLDFVLDPIALPTAPTKFCHNDEKSEFLSQITDLIIQAQNNTRKSEDRIDELEELKEELEEKMAAAFIKADDNAQTGDAASMNGYAQQYRTYKDAIAKLAAGVSKAKAQRKASIQTHRNLQNLWEAVFAIKISDCVDPNITPAGALGDTEFSNVDESIPDPEIKPVDIPTIPTKVCVQQEKYEVQTAAYEAVNNAWSNRDAWIERIQQIKSALLDTTDAAAKARLTQARAEARGEASKWTKIHEQTEAAREKADAIIVEDCAQKGGLLEVGKMSSSLPGVHADAPEANSRPYDLPPLPQFVCTHQEKEALVARASAARETASYNHGQWAPRASALGKLIYQLGYNNADRAKLIRAYAEARAQSDYWGEQMLEVAHKRYWDLTELEVRDCKKDKKVSFAEPSTTKVLVKGDPSMLDKLNDARKGQPFFNGGQIPITGYPKFLDKFQEEEQGFDGSEAENAVNDSIHEGLKTKKQEEPKPYPSVSGGTYPSKGKTAYTQYPAPLPDVVKTPEPTSPAPTPYPNTDMASATDKGVETTKVEDLEIKTDEIEYREGVPEHPKTKAPGLDKFPTISLGRGSLPEAPLEMYDPKNYTPSHTTPKTPVTTNPDPEGYSAPLPVDTPALEYGGGLNTFSPNLGVSKQTESVSVGGFEAQTETPAPKQEPKTFTATFGEPKGGGMTALKGPPLVVKTWDGRTLGLPDQTGQSEASPTGDGEYVQVPLPPFGAKPDPLQ